ncbi:hypothetical protein BaRGS_00014243, partial [Batillaria attramentaria]
CENLDSGVGIYACDPDAYTVFAEVFDPVIRDYHRISEKKKIHHPALDFGNLEKAKFEDLDPSGEFILSTRVRVARSHAGFGFPPVLTKEQREEMEQLTVEALTTLLDDLQGKYYALADMDRDTQDRLTNDHFLFNDTDRFLKSAGGYNDWPAGRGIYYNEAKTFLVWVNEEDHLRIISMQKGGDLGSVYGRLVKAVKALGEKLSFAHDDRLGFLTFCPTNLGTTLRASVHIKIPNLAMQEDFKAVCDKYHLQARGVHGEHTAGEDGVYDISNKRRLGLTEIAAVTEMYNGIRELIKAEKNLAWRPETLDDILQHLHNNKHHKMLVRKFLAREIVNRLKPMKTSSATLADCLRSGAWNLDSHIGIYAVDPECYSVYADIFDQVVHDYHMLASHEDIMQPEINYGNLEKLKLPDLDPEGSIVLSTRIRASRNLEDYGFAPFCSTEDRLAAERKVVEVLNSLTDPELKGTYHPLTSMDQETKEKLINEHVLFRLENRFRRAVSPASEEPEGRGVFYNEDKTFVVWVNEEDHVKIISMQKGGDVGAVYTRLVKGIKALEDRLFFLRDERMGFQTFCPSNVGTGLRASILVTIPRLSARKDFKSLCEKRKLQARGQYGERTEEGAGGVYDISNKRRLGIKEISQINEAYKGMKEIIKMEKDLAAGKSISCTIL